MKRFHARPLLRLVAASATAAAMVAVVAPAAGAGTGDPAALAVAAVDAAAAATAAALEPVAAATAVPLPAIAVPAASAPSAAEPVPTEAAPPAPPQEPVAAPPQEPPAAVAAPEPDAPPVAPANVNVSIRIDSPGDDGAVTQSNTVAAEEANPQYQPEPEQYQEADGAPVVPSEGDAPAAAEEWNWVWTCGGGTNQAADVELPPGTTPQTWNWNWDWNCDDTQDGKQNTAAKSAPQYHDQRSQYRPVNITVSIRINSSGANGPVTQANVVVGVPAVLPAAAGAPLAAALSVLPGPAAAAGPDVRPAARGEPGATGRPARGGITGSVDRDGAATLAVPLRPSPAETVPASPPVPPLAARLPGLRRAAAHEARRAAVASVPTLRPEHVPVVALGFAGAAGGGGGDRGLDLVLLFLLPFVLALADPVRRVASESAASVADRHGARRDKPG